MEMNSFTFDMDDRPYTSYNYYNYYAVNPLSFLTTSEARGQYMYDPSPPRNPIASLQMNPIRIIRNGRTDEEIKLILVKEALKQLADMGVFYEAD